MDSSFPPGGINKIKTNMKAGKRHIRGLIILLIGISSCSVIESQDNQGLTETNLFLEISHMTKASSDIGTPTHSVDRILVIPFQKNNLSLPDKQLNNFTPDWSLARQFDIAKFPTKSLSFLLKGSRTYKVLIIGYNHADYDHNNPTASTNRVVLNSQPLPTTLANFQLYPKLPNEVPEFFICYAETSGGNTVFIPTSGSNLKGKLGRIISALGVKVTNIPGYVKSVSLLADNMIKAIRLSDTTVSVIQVPGDNESRIIRKQNVSNGTVDFGEYLLPTGTANKMTIYLDISLGTLTQRYQMNIANSEVSEGGKLILPSNHAVRINASYNKINYGFVVTEVINLEDNTWDGIITNPAP